MNMPLISVVMSVYNAEDYLHEAIRSVLDQSLRDFEFIISNNGSTDSSKEIINYYCDLDNRIVLFDHKDLGFSNSLNQAIEIANTNLIARFDADDVMEVNRLERQYNLLKNNKNISVTSCLANYINNSGDVIGKTFSDLNSISMNIEYFEKNEPIGILHPGAMYYKNLFQEVGGYREEFAPAEDIDLWNRFNDHGYWVVVQQEILMNYRMIPNSEIGKNFKESRLKYEWLRECMRLRRNGKKEIDLDSFIEFQERLSLFTKINKYRKLQAKYYYRTAGIDYGARNILPFLLKIFLAVILQPSYSIDKLINQRRK